MRTKEEETPDMASATEFRPPSDIEITHAGKTQQYCGVCHGVLKVNESSSHILNKSSDNDAIIRTISSAESFPLPSSASAVGTVHPCGHLFHVSCFHNHNNKLLKSGKSETSKPMNSMVEILDDDGESCVEIKSSDEFEDSLTEEDFNECPTCRKRAFLFVEMSSTQMHTFPRPLSSAKLTVDPTETEDDDADTDIMNYYSFTNATSEDGENLFVDTTNIMAHNLMLLGIAHRNMKQSHSDASTEYHDVQTITSQLVTAAASPEEQRDDHISGDVPAASERREEAGEQREANVAEKGTKKPPAGPATKATKKLLHFDSRAMPTTPGIMITPGTIQRRKTNKKVRFFDDQTHSLLVCQSASGDGSPEKPALIDQVGSEEDETIVEITDEDVQDDEDEGVSSLEEQEDENTDSDNDSADMPLASSSETEESQDGILDLANVVLPSTDSKSLLWNVSTYEEDDEADAKEHGFVDKLQREIDTLRHQLIQSEQQREDAQRSMSLARTRDLGAVENQAKEIMKLRKEVERLTAHQAMNQEEIIAAEEELATTQIQLETAVDSHHQAQARLQDEMDKAQEELEDVRYQLEACQEELEKATKTAASQKEEIEVVQSQRQEEIKQEFEEKLEGLKEELSQVHKELEETKSQLETCGQQLEEQATRSESEKESLMADYDQSKKEYELELEELQEQIKTTREELVTAKIELNACEERICEQTKTAAAERENLDCKWKESALQMKQDHQSVVKQLQETITQTKIELEGARQELSTCKEELQRQIATTTAANVALMAKHKEDICAVKEEYGAKLEATYSKLANQMQSFQQLEAEIKQSQQHFGINVTALEAELERERKSSSELRASLEQSRKRAELSSSEQHCHLDKLKEHNKQLVSQRDHLEASRAQLVSELEKQQAYNEDLQSQLEETKREVVVSLTELQSEIAEQMKSYANIQSQLDQTKKDSEATRLGLESELTRQQQANAVLELQLEKYQEQMQKSPPQLLAELEQQKQLANKLASQLEQTQRSHEALEARLKKSQEVVEDTIKSELEKQLTSAIRVHEQLEQTQKQLESANAELEEVKAVNVEESEEMNFLREELESTRLDMEKLISNMQASDREMVVLRNELNAAKDALSAATHDIGLQRISTSTSSLSPRQSHSIDESTCVHSLQDELRVVKQELVAKNEFIQGQLTMAKGKLIEYVRTKEGELEHTKKELAETKSALKQKNVNFARQLQETEQELVELSSMKETLLATMNELAEKNSLITSQLEEAQAELEFLEEANQQLREENNQQPPKENQKPKENRYHQALAAKDLKLGNAFAFAAVFMGQWLSECAKAQFNLKNKPKDQADPIPEIAVDGEPLT